MTVLHAEKPICRSPLWRNLPLFIAAALCSAAPIVQGAPAIFVSTSSLVTARFGHTATLLPNGKVLVVGGFNNNAAVASAELYDPFIGMWRLTGSFNAIQESGCATLLPNGKVLVVGLSDATQAAQINAELFDPATGTWSNTGAPSFVPTLGHTVLLPNGKVLAVLESSPWDYGDTFAELYDPATGQWSTAGSLPISWAPTVTLLRNGKVLVTGLYGANYPTQAELYDPNTNTWSITGSLSTYRHYGGYTATLLADGQVLVAGGTDYNSNQPVTAEELYNPTTGAWSRTHHLIMGREYHTATLLPNGKVLVAGGAGFNISSIFASGELYDPASRTWTATGSLGTARYGHTATLLHSGEVLVAGGWGSGGTLASTELYDTPVSRLANFSTRGFVQTGNEMLIGGFIVTGASPKQVILRALGPTLGQPPFNVPNALANTRLELYDANNVLITSNDNWGSAPNAAAISASGFAPPNSLESAALTTLNPGNYTAIVRGADNKSGVAMVEGYDLDNTALSKFGNVSTRGFVQSGANVMIAGVIVQGPDSENVMIRGLGPTLGQPPFNVPNALSDPFLDLHDANGNLMMTNNNWGGASNVAAINSTGYAPPNSLESAILITLAPGNYTAILSGVNGAKGVGLVEIYAQ